MMKRKFTLFLLVLFGCNSRVIGYNPIPEDSLTKWLMRFEYVDPGVCHEVYYFNYRMTGDTTISGQFYKKLYSENLFLAFTQFGAPGCSNPPENKYIGAFRQDTLMKKAFFVLPGYNSDTLLYDFTLNVGDTLFSVVNDFTLGCANFNVISILDSVLVGGVYCQWQKFSNCVDGNVEGVGSLNDPFQSHLITDGSYSLVCLKRDTSVIFDQTSYGVFCNIFTTINESREFPFSVYPVPVQDYFELKFTENVNLKLVQIFDSFGRLIYRKSNSDKEWFSTEYLNEGIYLIEVVVDNGIKYSRKLIIDK